MSQKHIPARRSRPSRPGIGRPAAPNPYRPKRVRAGSATAKARRKSAADATAPPETAPAAAPELSERQRRHLRGLAHDLKPVIRLGSSGLTEAVAAETARALHDHELIKVKAPGGDREARDSVFQELSRKTGSALVYRIGNVAVLYRPHPKVPRILIPDSTP